MNIYILYSILLFIYSNTELIQNVYVSMKFIMYSCYV
jgi:hypothetical protein